MQLTSEKQQHRNHQQYPNTNSHVPKPPEHFEAALVELEAQFERIGHDYLGDDSADKLMKPFMAEFGPYLSSLPLCVKIRDSSGRDVKKYPTSGSLSELLNDDNKILAKDKSVDIEPASYATAAAGVYWRASQAAYIRITCKRLKTGAEEDRLEILELSRRAMYLDPNSYQVIRMHMLATGYLFEKAGWGAREKCFIGMAFREATGRCVEAKPDDYIGHSMLGRYYYTLGTMPWYERVLSKNFTTVKFDGGLEEAEREFLLTHKCRPKWMSTGLLMAKCLLALKRPLTEVWEWIEYGSAQEPEEAVTALEKPELLELRAKVHKQLSS